MDYSEYDQGEIRDQLEATVDVMNYTLKKMGMEPMTLEEYLEHR